MVDMEVKINIPKEMNSPDSYVVRTFALEKWLSQPETREYFVTRNLILGSITQTSDLNFPFPLETARKWAKGTTVYSKLMMYIFFSLTI